MACSTRSSPCWARCRCELANLASYIFVSGLWGLLMPVFAVSQVLVDVIGWRPVRRLLSVLLYFSCSVRW